MTSHGLPPLCRYCGKPIGKRSSVCYFGNKYAALSSTTRSERPRSPEEVERLLNTQVIAVRWDNSDEAYGRWISQAYTWDSETYKDRFFCSGPHAMRFAALLAEGGHCTASYREAAIAQEALS